MNELAVDLARFQFAFTVSFHIIFPAFTIGLASYLAVLEGLYLKTGKHKYIELYQYWIKIFAISFGMGVVSGIVMSYQFGTNWSVFSDKTGPILGPLMGYEVFTAFFLEAGFLGVMLFGMNRVGKKLHFMATVIVAIGTLMSAFWILSVNSWMQTPAGYSMNELGQFIPEDWWAVVFNPSFPYRLVHMVLAAFLTTAFVVGGVGAYHLLRSQNNHLARTMFSMALWMAAIVTPIQIVVGDLHGLNTLEHQPAKVAAMEGHFETQQGAPLILFGLPNEETKEVDYKVAIPHLGSLILTHEWNGEVKGLDAFPDDEHPPVSIVFWSFRIMVGLGFMMLAIGLYSLWLRKKGELYYHTLFHRCCVAMAPTGFIALLCGWITTEVGRQPYTVYGLLRTADSISPVNAAAVSVSVAAFVVVYFSVFGAGIFYLLRLMRKPPTKYVLPPTASLPDVGDEDNEKQSLAASNKLNM
ncbi:cytochrome ubiquinol oxidase subunit I [Photobacterium sp. DNB23_23_1]|uniref:Cytochrome ubiquinol oxidase subunit I n=1 Tax=Photobacterium pectinilyticum TaxID=2906793 RepID=A0ABT1N1Q2_9GAMM|nr:cytochrome ubiquinol oxidase subunit I [Photobacterium sp. ZSDE20]MCQ1057824.1 cytochrome ubiquinol oxidase subunit I [Photobacterium sp. ZSDE20]MDD1822264.1 cytochrome ubiquinol oxidase subunit I [Photobacterium sp. ZSDE20]